MAKDTNSTMRDYVQVLWSNFKNFPPIMIKRVSRELGSFWHLVKICLYRSIRFYEIRGNFSSWSKFPKLSIFLKLLSFLFQPLPNLYSFRRLHHTLIYFKRSEFFQHPIATLKINPSFYQHFQKIRALITTMSTRCFKYRVLKLRIEVKLHSS